MFTETVENTNAPTEVAQIEANTEPVSETTSEQPLTPEVLPAQPEPAEPTREELLAKPEPAEPTREELLAKLNLLTEMLAASQTVAKRAKNHVDSKPDSNRKYIILQPSLSRYGRVPQQQADIADILLRSFEVGVEVPEADLFEAINALAPQYDSLAKSVQSPTYIFKYYRGLKPENKHASYITRGFIRQIN